MTVNDSHASTSKWEYLLCPCPNCILNFSVGASDILNEVSPPRGGTAKLAREVIAPYAYILDFELRTAPEGHWRLSPLGRVSVHL